MTLLIDAMKTVLGTAFGLYVKSHGAHWNVEGPGFPQNHTFFGAQYDEIWQSIDGIAEQIRQLDAYAPSTMERFIALSKIVSQADPLPPREMMLALMIDHEIMLGVLKEALHAAEQEDRQGLVNFLAGRMEAHAKHRWQLRATSKQVREPTL